MSRIDKTVMKETIYIAKLTLILSLLMQAVFLILSKWSFGVLLGNIVGDIAAVGNFFLMGLSVQKALTKPENEVKGYIRATMTLRMFLMIIIAIIVYLVPVFHTVAAILPYLFPRIAISLRPVFKKD